MATDPQSPWCIACGEPAVKHYGRLTASVVSPWGLRTQDVRLCEHHMACVLNLLLSGRKLDAEPKPPEMLTLNAWAHAAEVMVCDLCDREFYTRAEPARIETITAEWSPIVACARCQAAPFGKLIQQVQAAASISDDPRFTRADVVRLLRSRGADAWL